MIGGPWDGEAFPIEGVLDVVKLVASGPVRYAVQVWSAEATDRPEIVTYRLQFELGAPSRDDQGRLRYLIHP